MGSRKIQIFRKSDQTKRKLPKDMLLDTHMSIGSYFLPNGQIGKGLNDLEVKKWMPQAIGVSKEDINFRREVDNFFADIALKVEESGLELEIGLDDEGHPFNEMDYIKYRFAKSHPEVAENEAIGRATHNARYFIYDPTLQKEIQYNTLQYKQKAYAKFMEISDDAKRMAQVLILLNEDPRKMSVADMAMRLDSIVSNSPQTFLDIIEDNNIEMRSFVAQCISAEVLRKVGNSIYHIEEKLGANIDDAITYLNDQINSETLTILKGKLQEFLKG